MLPDFSNDTFMQQFHKMSPKGEFNSFMLSLTAILDGHEVRLYRTQAEAGMNVEHFPARVDAPVLYSVRGAGKVLHFSASRCEVQTPQPHARVRNKSRFKQRLARAGINTPFGGAVTSKSRAVLDAMKQANVARVSVKPVMGSGSRGVHLYQSLAQAEAIIDNKPEQEFIIDQMIVGAEFRITASKTDIVAAHMIIPAHVVGDGVSTLQELIEAEAVARKRNPAMINRPLDLRDILYAMAAQGKVGTAVLKEGEIYRLTLDGLPTRAFRVPVLDRLPKSVSTIAMETVKLIDGVVCGLDIVVDRAGVPYILDVDANSGMWFECFPYPNGDWNLDVPRYILKHYFPRHKRVERKILSYDFAALKAELLREGRASSGVNAVDFVEFG
jgi:D-alanine-D-alanine ligase-like ATP-grasp enzyme